MKKISLLLTLVLLVSLLGVASPAPAAAAATIPAQVTIPVASAARAKSLASIIGVSPATGLNGPKPPKKLPVKIQKGLEDLGFLTGLRYRCDYVNVRAGKCWCCQWRKNQPGVADCVQISASFCAVPGTDRYPGY